MTANEAPVTATPALPASLQGGWFRVSIAFDGGEPEETQTVWWLQGDRMFADLRVPLDAGGDADSFAGVTTWNEPSLTWHRDLDLHARPDADTGVISWDGDDMIEDGTFAFAGGERRSYSERWRRLPDPGGGFGVALTNETSRLVCVGNYAITIVDDRDGAGGGSYRATGWHRPSVLWEHVMSWPENHPGVSEPPDDIEEWIVGATVRLDDGTTWTVKEIAK